MKKISYSFLAIALLMSGQIVADNMYPGAWITACDQDKPVVEDELCSSYYAFHAFNPDNGDEEIFNKYGKQQSLEASEVARIKEVFKQINADLDTASLDLATFDVANLGGYADWIADYEVSFDAAVEAKDYQLVGSYDAYKDGEWVLCESATLKKDSVIGLMSAWDPNLKYYELVKNIPIFNCGVIGLDESILSKTISVKLCLYNPKDKSDKKEVVKQDYKFTTTGLVNVEQTSAAKKQMVNGQMVIIRDGQVFNALGAQL